MHPTMLAEIAADQIRDMQADAARDRLARMARRGRRAAKHAVTTRQAATVAAGAWPRRAGRELAERHA